MDGFSKGHEQQPLMPMGNSCCSGSQSTFKLRAKIKIPFMLFHLSFRMQISPEQHLSLMINKVSLQNILEKFPQVICEIKPHRHVGLFQS